MRFPLLKPEDIEVRVGTIARSGNSLTLLLYKDARVDMRLLDETVGSENWQCKYYRGNDTLFCSVGIKCGEDWVWKDDCGTESTMESKKGEASDAFKRACFKWGIGRELYTAPEVRVPAGLAQIKDGKCYDRFKVTALTYEDGKIAGLTIYNETKGRVCFSTLKEQPKDALYNQVLEGMMTLAEKRGISLQELTAEWSAELGTKIDGANHACMVWCVQRLEKEND